MAREFRKGRSLTVSAVVAVKPAKRSGRPTMSVIAVGKDAPAAASSTGAEIRQPFAHPRSLVSDFIAGEALLRHVIRQVTKTHWLAVSPYLVLHPLEKLEGGLTEVEERAFQEMGLGAGAAKTQVWTGRPLTDEEILARRLPFDA